MASIIINHNDKKDRQGLLAKANLQANELVKLCELSSFTYSLIIAINILNANDESTSVSYWISDKDSPENIDLIERNIILNSDAVYIRNNIVMGLNEKLFIRSDKDNVIVRVDGYDNRSI